MAAGDPAAPGAAAALDALCRAYWYPVYAYVRRCGQSAIEAEDLTQSFFLHLLTSKALATATPHRADDVEIPTGKVFWTDPDTAGHRFYRAVRK